MRFNDGEELEQALTWLDENTDGKPYGVDVVMPMKIPTEGKAVDLKAMIPEEHRKFVERTLRSWACHRCRKARAGRASSAGCTRWHARTSTSRCSTGRC